MKTMKQSGLWSSLGTQKFLPQDVAFSIAARRRLAEQLRYSWLSGGYVFPGVVILEYSTF